MINVVASRSPGATRRASCLDTVVGLTVVCGITWGNKKGSFTDIRKMFGKMFKVLISSETLSTPTAPRVSPEMQLSYTSNSTLSWNIINPFWAAFCSSHGVICLSHCLFISLRCFSLLHITMSYKYLPHKTSGCALIVYHGVCSIPPVLVWV